MAAPVMPTPEQEGRIVDLLAQCDRLRALVTERGGKWTDADCADARRIRENAIKVIGEMAGAHGVRARLASVLMCGAEECRDR